MPKLLRPAEIASLFDVHVGTVRGWLREGRLPAIKTPGGQYRIDPDAAREALGLEVPTRKQDDKAAA